MILLSAASLDYLVGDPWNWIHPVQVIGGVISRLTQWGLNITAKPPLRRLIGVFIGLGVILGTGLMGWCLVAIASQIHPFFGIMIQIILLASCFAGKSLRLAAQDVLKPLNEGNLEQARVHLSRYVGRDTENLSESEILRAVLETVAENAVDGVTAPLFYAILGLFIPTIGSVSLALGYKASSTLDSMVGYLSPPYTEIGWFSAKVEDYLTWLPCRLTVFSLGILSGNPFTVWQICRRDAPLDPSPNSGWSEAAYAAILDVQLGGKNSYNSVIKAKPLLGEPLSPITSEKIHLALQYTRWVILIWLGVGVLVWGILAKFC